MARHFTYEFKLKFKCFLVQISKNSRLPALLELKDVHLPLLVVLEDDVRSGCPNLLLFWIRWSTCFSTCVSVSDSPEHHNTLQRYFKSFHPSVKYLLAHAFAGLLNSAVNVTCLHTAWTQNSDHYCFSSFVHSVRVLLVKIPWKPACVNVGSLMFISNGRSMCALVQSNYVQKAVRGLLEKYPTVFFYANTWWIII